MSDITLANTEDIIEAEICEQHFPGTGFIAQVHRDSFSDWVFECTFGEDADEEDYIEFLVGEPSGCPNAYTHQGEVVFMHKETKEITYTNETHVFSIEDVTVVYSENESEDDYQQLEY